MDDDVRQPLFDRRTLLGGAVGAAAVTAGGLVVAPAAVAHGDIASYDAVWGAKTRYEITGNYASFGYRPSFHIRLGDWLEYWYNNTPSVVLKPMVLWSYGCHVDDGGDPGHVEGRAFDLSRIYADDGTGTRVLRFNGLYSNWKDWPEDAVKRTVRRQYWATSASANYWFRDVLHYYWNTLHYSHLHIDNTESGLDFPHYNTDSRAQTLHVQACCRHVWGLPTDIDGAWGSQTQSHSTRVLRAVGMTSGDLTSSRAHWQAFNRGTMRNGYGTQSYPAP